MHRFGLLLWGVVFVSLFTGCGDDTHKSPKLVKVSGKVTLDGQPMATGEVRFNMMGEPPQCIPVKDGSFAGNAFIGQNTIDVVSEIDGPPHPMDPSKNLKVNAVDARFSGPNTPFKQEVSAGGANDLSYDVTSAK